MIKQLLFILVLGIFLSVTSCSKSPDYEKSAQQLAECIIPGHEKEFVFTLVPAEKDFFELRQKVTK